MLPCRCRRWITPAATPWPPTCHPRRGALGLYLYLQRQNCPDFYPRPGDHRSPAALPGPGGRVQRLVPRLDHPDRRAADADPDPILARSPHIIATADSVILDGTRNHAGQLSAKLARQAGGFVDLTIPSHQALRWRPALSNLPPDQMLQVPKPVFHAFRLALRLAPLLGKEQAAKLSDILAHGPSHRFGGGAQLARKVARQLALDLVELLLGLGQEIGLPCLHPPGQLAIDLFGQGAPIVGQLTLIAFEIAQLA